MTKDFESRISKIEERNVRVENDKRWETSLFRRLLITSFTYLLVVSFLKIIQADKPYLAALVPATGYFLSTLAINPIKRWWLKQ